MDRNECAKVIVDIFNQNEKLRDIDWDLDIYDAGGSSLTIVALQLKIEEVLKINVDIGDLIEDATINSWIDCYCNAG